MAKRQSKKGKKRKFNTNFRKAVTKDSERQKQAQSGVGYLNLPSGVPVFKAPPGGRVKMDILPYIVSDSNHPDRYEDEGIAVPGELWYKRPFSIHRGIGVENDRVVCPKSVGKPCPICEYKEKRLKNGADWDEVSELNQSLRNLYVVKPLRHKDFDEVPHVWDVSQYLFQNLLNEELEEDEDNAVFPDLEEGKTLKIRFSEEKFGSNTYAETSRIDFNDRKKGYGVEILDEVPNLDEILEIKSYTELEAAFLEVDPEDLADDYDDDPPRRKKSAEPEEPEDPEDLEDEWEEEEGFDDEEFEDEEFEEPEEEDEWEEDEEWEEEWEDEEEPEPEPKPKPTRTKKKTKGTKSKRKRKK